MQLRPVHADDAADIMAGRQAIGAEIARHLKQVGELHALIAAHARDRSAARDIFVRKPIDHRFPECALIIEHIMRDAEPIGDRPRIRNIAPCAAASRAPDRRAMIVKLQCDADRLGPALRRQRRHDRAVDPARHRHDDAANLFGPELKPITHDAAYLPDAAPPVQAGLSPDAFVRSWKGQLGARGGF